MVVATNGKYLSNISDIKQYFSEYLEINAVWMHLDTFEIIELQEDGTQTVVEYCNFVQLIQAIELYL